MSRERLKALHESLSALLAWDGDGQPLDHGEGGAINDRVRAARRRLNREWLTLPETTGVADLMPEAA